MNKLKKVISNDDKGIDYNNKILASDKLAEVTSLSDAFQNYPMSAGIRFYTEEQYLRYLKEIHKLDRLFDSEKGNKRSEEIRPYVIFTIGLPIKKIIEYDL